MIPKVVVDMNLTPDWVPYLVAAGFEAVHWRNLGAVDAVDSVIMDWARTNGFVVLTQDLDFGTLLALTNAESPSVILLRTDDVLPDYIGQTVLDVLMNHADELTGGALLRLDATNARVRLLPLNIPNNGQLNGQNPT